MAEGRRRKPAEALLFAIRRHCEARRSDQFFLSTADAATVAGCAYATGWRLMRSLVREGKLQLLTEPQKRKARDAFDYRLLDKE